MTSPIASIQDKRINGLDTLRAAAIVLVFMYHYMVFVSREPTFGWASVIGWTGVDLFFVLSGYLIADQIFRGIVRGRTLSLRAFFARRALRTLPNYWVVLALFFLFPAFMGGKEPPPLWTFLSFTQNFGLRTGTAFSHAWSLCIEEQFYLALPLAIVVAVRYGRSRVHAWWVLAALIATGIVARSLLWMRYGEDPAGYYTHVYYTTLCRFDEFLPGVAVAMLKHFHPAAWERLMRAGRTMFFASMAATCAMFFLAYRFYEFENGEYGYFMTGFGYSLIAVSFAMLTASALESAFTAVALQDSGRAPACLVVVRIYLTHKPIAMIIRREFPSLSGPLMQLVITAACLAGGHLLFRLVETPFMQLRKRIAPDNFTGACGQTASAPPVTASTPP